MSSEHSHPSLPQGFLRLSAGPEAITDSLGPLAHLIGTWAGNQGFNMIAVPAVFNGKETFSLEVMPYYETMTFMPIGAPVLDKGGFKTLSIVGLHYDLRVIDSTTNEPLHIENGMWLLLHKDQVAGRPSIARQSIIPHGNSLLALGDFDISDGAPKIPDINALPHTGPGAPAGYTDPWLTPMKGFNKVNPNQNLQAAIKEQDILKTITLNVSTKNDGGIVNIPFIVKHADATAFESVFWIEKVKDAVTGTVFEQLQYSQQTNINFLPRFDDPSKLIMWPHVNINTLVKQ